MTNILALCTWIVLLLSCHSRSSTASLILNAIDGNLTKVDSGNDSVVVVPSEPATSSNVVEIVGDFGVKMSCFVNSVDPYLHNLVNNMVKIEKASLLEYVFVIRNYR